MSRNTIKATWATLTPKQLLAAVTTWSTPTKIKHLAVNTQTEAKVKDKHILDKMGKRMFPHMIEFYDAIGYKWVGGSRPQSLKPFIRDVSEPAFDPSVSNIKLFEDFIAKLGKIIDGTMDIEKAGHENPSLSNLIEHSKMATIFMVKHHGPYQNSTSKWW